jgi:histidinol-phosphate aminotransferase
MIRLPENIERLQSYKPGKPIEELVKELGLTQTAILWNNENNLGASPRALEAMSKAMSSSYLYPDPLSTDLRTKLAHRLGKKPENIVVGNGSEGLLMNILKAYCSGKDELLTSDGSFVIIYVWSMINNIPVVRVPLTSDYRYDMKAIADRIGPKTKVVYLSNINNPTGAMITGKEISEFMSKVPPHVLVIADEAYFEFSKGITGDFPDTTTMGYKNVITLRTFSKSYGIAAVRIGYAIAEPEVIDPLVKVKLTFEPSNMAQAAGIGALDDEDFLERTISNNIEGLEYFYCEFDKMGLKHVPSFGNFVMLDLGTPERVQEIFQALMKKGVFVRPLVAFGLPHCIRITVGTPSDNRLCVEKLEEVLSVEVGSRQ